MAVPDLNRPPPYESNCSLQGYFMVFVTLQASVFHSAVRWMEEWPRDILSAQSLNVVMLVPSDSPGAIQDFEKWENVFRRLGRKKGAECDIGVTRCRMLRRVCGRMKSCFSSVRIRK